MKKTVIVLLLLIIPISILYSKGPEKVRNTPKKCEVYKPELASARIDEQKYADFMGKYGQNGAVPSMQQFWDVFSDRDENQTYYAPNDKKPFMTLKFKEKVRIARIRGNYALVFRTPADDYFYPELPESVEWLGWVPVSNLVLFDSALQTNFGIDIKILLADTPDNTYGETLGARLFSIPLSSETRGRNLPDCSNSIFYLIKKEHGMSLLSLSPDLTLEENIYGWVDDSYLMEWRSRIAVEPTWDPGDVGVFVQHQEDCSLLGKEQNIIGKISYKLDSSDPYSADSYRQLAGRWRFPLLSASSEAVRCAVQGSSPFMEAPTRRYLPNKKSTDVNVCFVLDGSRLYEPYYPLLADFIQSLSSRYKGSFTFNVAAIIYHDTRTGDMMLETQQFMRSDSQDLYDFIDRGGEYGFQDNLSEAPVLSALDRASYLFEKGDHNFVVLVGGRGDSSDADMSPSDLASAFSDMGVNFCALQVQNNPYTSGYRIFSYMSDNIAYTTASDRLSPDSGEGGRVAVLHDDSDEVTCCTYKAGTIPCFETVYSMKTGLMDESAFSYYLSNLMDRIVEFTVTQDAASPVFFRTCTIPRIIEGHQTVKLSALFTKDELMSLMSTFDMIRQVYYESDDRATFVRVLTNTLEEKGIVVDNIKEMGLYEVFSKMECIIPDNFFYQGRKIKELLTPLVSDNEYRFIMETLSAKLDRLKKIVSTPSVYRSVINGEYYYWVPIEDLF